MKIENGKSCIKISTKREKGCFYRYCENKGNAIRGIEKVRILC